MTDMIKHPVLSQFFFFFLFRDNPYKVYNISVMSQRPVHQPMLYCNFFLTSTPQNILSKPLADFPHNHPRNKVSRDPDLVQTENLRCEKGQS